MIDHNQEQKARYRLKRLGYRLEKCRHRLPSAMSGLFRIIDPGRNIVVGGGSPLDYSMTLEDVVRWINDRHREL